MHLLQRSINSKVALPFGRITGECQKKRSFFESNGLGSVRRAERGEPHRAWAAPACFHPAPRTPASLAIKGRKRPAGLLHNHRSQLGHIGRGTQNNQHAAYLKHTAGLGIVNKLLAYP